MLIAFCRTTYILYLSFCFVSLYVCVCVRFPIMAFQRLASNKSSSISTTLCLFLYVCARGQQIKRNYEHWAQVAISCFVVLCIWRATRTSLYTCIAQATKVAFLHETITSSWYIGCMWQIDWTQRNSDPREDPRRQQFNRFVIIFQRYSFVSSELNNNVCSNLVSALSN